MSASQLASKLTTTLESQSPTQTSGVFKVESGIIEVNTLERVELLNITESVANLVLKSTVSQGQVFLQTLHTTSALLLSEWQEALKYDLLCGLEAVIPRERDWRHNDRAYSDCDRQNADSHLRSVLLGQTLMVQVRESKILLGVWQQILFAELDGPRTRSVSVQVFGI